MKISLNPAVIACLFTVAVSSASLKAADSNAISIDRTQYFTQTGASTLTTDSMPFSLNIHIRGGGMNMTNWGPAFYIPGSGGVPQSGSSSATVTGTLNFSATPNNGTDFMFVHDFATHAAMEAAYPNGAYGIKFLGSTPPTPNTFVDGLVFSGPSYPSVTPQISAVNNGAVWSGGKLRLKRTGETTLSLNTLPEYASTTYGTIVTAGFWNATGDLATAGKETGYLPMGDSTEDSAPIYYAPITELKVNGAWFTPGQTYTLELQYAILGGRPEEENLNSVQFQGVSAHRKVTTLSVVVEGGAKADFNTDGKSDVLWRENSTGRIVAWNMNGTTMTSLTTLAAYADWTVVGSGDFNGDGNSDLVWRQTGTGTVVIWLMNGTSLVSSTTIANYPDWTVGSAGDFNGDGKSDLIWRETSTGRVVMWLMDGTSLNSMATIATYADWTIVGSGDFNADGKSDLIWRETSTGTVVIWTMNGATMTSLTTLATYSDWIPAGTGDFNADGHHDLIWRQTGTGTVVIWMMNGTSMTSMATIANYPDWQVVNR